MTLSDLPFCRYLDERYCEDVTQGITTTQERMQRCRELILRMGEADKADGKGVSLRQAFEWVYSEPLEYVPELHLVGMNGGGR